MVDTEVVTPRIALNLDHSMEPSLSRRSCQAKVETAVMLTTMQKDRVIHIQAKRLKFLLVRFRAVDVGFVKVPIIVNETAHKNHKTNQRRLVDRSNFQRGQIKVQGIFLRSSDCRLSDFADKKKP